MAKDKDKDRDKNKHDDETPEEPIIRDKRRIDPETGDVRTPEGAGETDDLDEELQRMLDTEQETADAVSEHLADLKRLQAEYANYRKRVERDRSVAREVAIADVLSSLLPVLDDLDLAEAHGDLEEGSPLALVAQKFRNTLERQGLERLEPAGETFDPMLHEAIAHIPSDEAENTVVDVAVVGYRIGERLIRPAKVAVAAPKE